MFNKVIVKGTAPGGEVWSVGVAMAFPDDDAPDTAALLQPLATNMATYWSIQTSTNQMIKSLSTSLFITTVRLEARDEDESLVALYDAPVTPVKQGSGTLKVPLQTSACLSLVTDTPGARGRGRIYWPNLTLVPTSDGRIPSADCDAFLFDLSQWFVDLIAVYAPTYNGHPGVRSVTDHVTREITVLRCGDVPDVQRRRRDALVEAYHFIAAP